MLNQEYQIDLIVNNNSYNISAKVAGSLINETPTLVNAASGDSGNGGGSIVGKYQINIGLDTVVRASGWGAGTWGRGTWGSASTDAIITNTLRLWSHDNFGEDLLINARDGGIYYWSATLGLGNRAVDITSLSTTGAIPSVAKQVMVSDRDRHIIAFGCDPESTPGVQDPLTIRFSSQESLTDWSATATNTAGELRLGS